jgi:type II secretory ATPase GspE/PulE/Tfp pilus assembly ATPase PilB-like protein
VDQILARAAADHASDIHLEPQEHWLRLRLRVDGVLAEAARLPQRLAPSITARLKMSFNSMPPSPKIAVLKLKLVSAV